MLKFILGPLIAASMVPIYNTYQLNSAVAHLREGPNALPFFAYYRYGIDDDTVVFNVTQPTCADAIDAVLPAFSEFVGSLRADAPAQVRLAWHGQTVIVLNVAGTSDVSGNVMWDDGHSITSLERAIGCNGDDLLTIDWMMVKSDGTTLL